MNKASWLWISAAVFFFLFSLMAAWAIQGLWLSGFVSEPNQEVFAVRVYIRGGIALLMLLLSVGLAYKAWNARLK